MRGSRRYHSNVLVVSSACHVWQAVVRSLLFLVQKNVVESVYPLEMGAWKLRDLIRHVYPRIRGPVFFMGLCHLLGTPSPNTHLKGTLTQ